MRTLIYGIIGFLIVLPGCSMRSSYLVFKGTDRDVRVEKLDSGNYEYTARNAMLEMLSDHFRIHVEIDKPVMLSFPEPVPLDDLYRLAGIEGYTTIIGVVDEHGAIPSYEIIQRAGFGLDEIARRVVEGIRVAPASYRGEPCVTRVTITIAITGRP